MPKKLLRRLLPNHQRIRDNRMIAWMGPALDHPGVWHVSRRGIALGLSIGVFFGLLIPAGQIPVAAAVAIAMRVNLPVAVAGTLITNPLTFAPLYYLAYRIGAALIGAGDAPAVTETVFDANAGDFSGWWQVWIERIARLGKPFLLGIGIMATSSALLCYFFIDGLWRVITSNAWRRRRLQTRSGSGAAGHVDGEGHVAKMRGEPRSPPPPRDAGKE